ncbi:MAG: redoxin domain-containing protein [Proteobacteria bacterium]|nr:redoxin domain-containing protein [Pseudomonadota bacterium]
MRSVVFLPLLVSMFLGLVVVPALVVQPAQAEFTKGALYDPGTLKPRDSKLKVAVGDPAPEFELPSLVHGTVRLSDYLGKQNVVLSFVPAAWTPVCSGQWPGYNLAKRIFSQNNTVLLGITVDNLPTLHAWTAAMGDLWFPVLSDFWPHGEVASRYGLLRGEGVTERALVVIDTKGVIRYLDVSDINKRPDLGVLAKELDKLNQ